MKNTILLPFIMLSLSLFGQDELTFDASFIQNSKRQPVSENKIKLNPSQFTIELVLPAYMLEFEGKKYSSVSFIATTDKKFFKAMRNTECFKCGQSITPFAFVKHNASQSIVIGEKGYSFWMIMENGDNHNVTSYAINDNQIFARVDVKKLILANSKKTVSLEDFTGTIYLVFEAVNRDSSRIGKREYVKVKIK